ncbi:hypothetical protein ABEB36_012595 [Hypothenemus hampei]|uniref:Uncharacterized protein n=1 Tax=Hypothenemus hampei TaxID=57062 RepID=A0ABD1EC43_HYPHA
MGLLDISTLLLQLSGLWPVENNKSKLKKTFYNIYRRFLVIWFVIFCIFQSLGFIRLILKKESFGRLSNSLTILLTVILMILNITIFNKKKVAYLCQNIIIYEKVHLLNTKDLKMSVIYQAISKKNKFLKIFTLLTSILGTLLFIGVSLLLLYNAGPDFWKSDAPFMFELYVPFDRQNYYWFIIIENIFIVCSGSMFYITCQTTFYGLFLYGTLRFQILQLKIEKLSIYGGENSFEKLRSLILEHQDIIK